MRNVERIKATLIPTRKAYEVYTTMERFLQCYGYMPTQNEIAQDMGLSTATVSKHIRRLRLCGYIEQRRGKTRGITLLKGVK